MKMRLWKSLPSHPSQWQGFEDPTGKTVYIRWRGCQLFIGIGDDIDSAVAISLRKPVMTLVKGIDANEMTDAELRYTLRESHWSHDVTFETTPMPAGLTAR